ncbi:MAG: hypothetical protein PHQ12_14020, partial [Chthoniobacteraceae bacterium]|nr:hypothetical protein [Chthoniobacteraceae bacterium]
MNSFLPLARKDGRRARVWIAATWFLAALPLVLTLVAGGRQSTFVIATAFLQWMAVGALTVNAARLVLMDPADDPAAFLATRPVSFPSVLLPKLAVIFGLLLLPATALHVAQIAALRIPLSGTNYGLLALETLLGLSALTFAALIPAFFCRNLGDYLMTFVLCGIAIAGVVLFVRWDAPSAPVLGWESYQLKFSRPALVLLLCPVGALAVMAVYARSRSWRRAGAVFAVAAIGIVLVRALWPLDYLQPLIDNGLRAAPAERPDIAQVSAHFEKPRAWGGTVPHFIGVGHN